MTTKPDTSGVEFISPLEITQDIDGRSVTVTPLVLSELPAFIALVVPLIASTPGFGPGFFKRLQSGELNDAELLSMLTAFAVNGTELIDMIVLCTRSHAVHGAGRLGDPPQKVLGAAHATWIRGLLFDRALSLAATCIFVNADFFKRAMPQIRAMASQAAVAPAAPAASPAGS